MRPCVVFMVVASFASSCSEPAESDPSGSPEPGATSSAPTTAGVPATGAPSASVPAMVEPALGGSADDSLFAFAWEDQFDTLDTSRWALQTHSWDGNLAQFSTTNASVQGGILSLNLTATPEDASKPYRGVEYRSRDTLTYGRVEARARFAKGSAVVSSLVLLYTPWPPDDWNELDIECLGQSSDEVQFNHMINIPPADPISGHQQYPELKSLGFDPTLDFHIYTIEWLPGVARFFVDGNLQHEATEEMNRMVLPQNILLTIWATDAAGWAGPVDATTAPTSAEFDWIRVYDYLGG